MSELTDLKAKVVAQNAALDTISGNVTGVAGDITFLKQKLADLEGGATAEEIAELKAVIDEADAKIAAIGSTTATLDAETDSSQPEA